MTIVTRRHQIQDMWMAATLPFTCNCTALVPSQRVKALPT